MKYFLLLLLTCPAFATITLTQSNNGATGAVSTLNCALSSAVAAGDLIIVGVEWGGTTGTFAYTDNHSGSYTAITNTPVLDGAGNEISMGYAVNASSQTSLTTTITITGGSTHTIRMGCYEFHTDTGTWSFDVSNTGTGTTVATGNGGSITPAASGELLFSVIQLSVAASGNFTVTGCTLADAGGTAGQGWGSAFRAEGAYNLSSGNISTTCQFSWTGSVSYSAVMSAFKTGAATVTRRRAMVISQ